MRGGRRVVLDACELIPMPLADTLASRGGVPESLLAQVVGNDYGRGNSKLGTEMGNAGG